MVSLTRLNVSKRLGLMIASAVLGIIVISGVFLYSERVLILQERQDGVRQTVEVAKGVVAHFHQQAQSGKLSEAEAKRMAMDAVKSLRYSGAEYFWINDMQPKMVMHSTNPQLDGQNLADIKDPNGKRLFVEFVETVKSHGSGVVNYMWPKPGSTAPVPKVSYVAGFEPWGWVIGSGVYVDNVDAAVMQRAMWMSAGALGLAVALLGIGLLVARSILRQLGGEPAYATAVTHEIAAGDLSVNILTSKTDGASVLDAIDSMRCGLAGIVVNVRQGAEMMATASSEIAQGNLDLSQRTEQQASALEETAATMEELTSTVKMNAENAKQASQLAHGATASAQRGGTVVSNVVETMRRISESSEKISEIISVVDGIAFQTNILALNAAVEAARAGEQGRGFAVVASEVRSLAKRSAEAAKEVKALIVESGERVERGVSEVDDARSAMSDVVQSIQRVSNIMEEISAASVEQSQGIAQVGEAVNHMDLVTQQNAALVEQSAAAAASLKEQASRLVNAVSVFRTSDVPASGALEAI